MKRYLNVSRPCYDKRHRCPGSVGGGMKSAKVELCHGGYVNHPSTLDPNRRASNWEFGRCKKCGVLVLPSNIQYVDPSNWPWLVRSMIRDIKWKYHLWQDERRWSRDSDDE
jgi:hypothetical protein